MLARLSKTRAPQVAGSLLGQRVVAPVAVDAVRQVPCGPSDGQVRQVASMKAVKERMRSVSNLIKITKAMKMVAAAKLKGDTRRMEMGLPFVAPVKGLFERLPREEKGGAITSLLMTSDKGLCGGVNSAVAKMARLSIADEEAKGNTCKLVIMGGKGVSAMKRLFADRFICSFEELGKLPFSYAAASIIAERLIKANPNRLQIISNNFRTVVSYDTITASAVTLAEAQTMDKSEYSKAMDVYSFEPSIYEVWNDLHEFYYSCIIYGGYLENSTTEQASRMGAMENASKNAGEMLDKLSLIYNRARQAKITTELCEIISGASAV